jgi:hypothetical protein
VPPGRSSRGGDRVTDVVSITVPAAPGWSGVVELVLAGLGARLDLPYDRIDELQLATTAVLEDALGPDVQVDAAAGADSVDIRVGPLGAAAGDPARRRVLDALADSVAVERGDDGDTWAVLRFVRSGTR